MTSLLDRPITAANDDGVCHWHAAKLWQTRAKLLKLNLICIISCTTSKKRTNIWTIDLKKLNLKHWSLRFLRELRSFRSLRFLRCLRLLRCVRCVRCVVCVGWKPRYTLKITSRPSLLSSRKHLKEKPTKTRKPKRSSKVMNTVRTVHASKSTMARICEGDIYLVTIKHTYK